MIGRRTQAMLLLAFPLLAAAAYEAGRGLQSARAEQAIAIGAARPVPLRIDAGVAIIAPDRAAARRALVQLLGDRASAQAVRLTTGAGARTEGHFVSTDLVAEGDEAAVRRFAAAIESGRPTARLARWTLTPTGTGLRLDARSEAAWQTAGSAPPHGESIAVAAPGPAPVASADLFAQPSAAAANRAGFPAQLIGIVGRIAVDPQAMLRLSGGQTRTVAVGETVAGWTVAGIAADRVRFHRGTEERTLVLPAAVDQ